MSHCVSAAAAPPPAPPRRPGRAERRPARRRFRDRGRDDRAVAVVDRARPQRVARRDQFVAGRQHRDARPPHHVDLGEAARRQHADLARADDACRGAAPFRRARCRSPHRRRTARARPRDGRRSQARRRRPTPSARSSPRRRRRAASRRRSRSRSRCRARPRGRRVPAGQDLRVEREAAGRRIGRAGRVGGAQREAVDTARSNGGTSTGAATSCASTRPSASASATVSAGERREIELPLEARARLLGRDDLEELLLPRGRAHRIEQGDSARRFHGSFMGSASRPSCRPESLRSRAEPGPSHGARTPASANSPRASGSAPSATRQTGAARRGRPSRQSCAQVSPAYPGRYKARRSDTAAKARHRRQEMQTTHASSRAGEKEHRLAVERSKCRRVSPGDKSETVDIHRAGGEAASVTL